ncbi:MAG TPA: acyl-CoA dehydrogenase family protein [Baekduia sp.]|nr:acyl-CoA dehydrogenase family protein [Baekduia sp.]
MSTTVAIPSQEELVQRAASLRPLLQEHAAAADRDRRIDPVVVEAVTDAGLFKLMVPKRLGGYETDLRTLLEVVAELGRGCMSTSWIGGVLNFSAWQASMFPEQAQRDIWEANPEARVCSVLGASSEATEVDGGITVTGSWPAASGAAHSDWVVLSVPTSMGPNGPVFTGTLVPLSDLTIEDTWFVAGVRGSESNTIIADNVFVPQHHMVNLMDATAGIRPNVRPEETLYQSSWSGVGAVATLVPQLGLANAVFDRVTEKSQGRRLPPLSIPDQSEDPAFQMRVADAAAKIELAWMMARTVCDEVDAAAKTGQLPSDISRGRARMFSALASDYVHTAVETMISEAGSGALMDADPLQRLWRDMATAHRHTAYRLDPARKVFGRILLGKGPGVSARF